MVTIFQKTAVSFSILFLFCFFHTVSAGWKVPPKNWGDVRIGLVNDNTAKINQRMKQAVKEGVKLNYRYVYINGGFDSTSNCMSWLFTQYTDYVKQSDSLAGVKPSFVIYILQEEGGSTAAKANVQNVTKMKKYFAIVRSIATRCKGLQSVFVIEPDTWGYLIQDGNMDPAAIPACISQVAQEFTWLQGLPDNLCGVAQGIIRTVHTFAPDAFTGVLTSHWSVIPTVGWHVDGLVWAQDTAINESIRKNVAWFSKLLGTGQDRGDFIGVEKYGCGAGWYKVNNGSSRYYWGDQQMRNYLRWSKELGKGLNLPVVGWQISIGHIPLPNVTKNADYDNSYEDTFFPYFFTHVNEFLDAGFIGFLAGKGIKNGDSDFSNETEGEVADRGWFFSNLKLFDKNRPYLPLTGISDPQKLNRKDPAVVVGMKNNALQLNIFDDRDMPPFSIDLFTLKGAFIKTLHNGVATSSIMTIPFQLQDISHGMYVVRISYGTFSECRKIKLMK